MPQQLAQRVNRHTLVNQACSQGMAPLVWRDLNAHQLAVVG
jgi:hypothetical protein